MHRRHSRRFKSHLQTKKEGERGGGGEGIEEEELYKYSASIGSSLMAKKRRAMQIVCELHKMNGNGQLAAVFQYTSRSFVNDADTLSLFMCINSN